MEQEQAWLLKAIKNRKITKKLKEIELLKLDIQKAKLEIELKNILKGELEQVKASTQTGGYIWHNNKTE